MERNKLSYTHTHTHVYVVKWSLIVVPRPCNGLPIERNVGKTKYSYAEEWRHYTILKINSGLRRTNSYLLFFTAKPNLMTWVWCPEPTWWEERADSWMSSALHMCPVIHKCPLLHLHKTNIIQNNDYSWDREMGQQSIALVAFAEIPGLIPSTFIRLRPSLASVGTACVWCTSRYQMCTTIPSKIT